jgi:hypothetical protein
MVNAPYFNIIDTGTFGLHPRQPIRRRLAAPRDRLRPERSLLMSNIGSAFWAILGAIGGLIVAAIYFLVCIGLFDAVIGGKSLNAATGYGVGAKVGLLMLIGVPIGALGAMALLDKPGGRIELGVIVALILSALAIYAFFDAGGLKLVGQYKVFLFVMVAGLVAILGFTGRAMLHVAAA